MDQLDILPRLTEDLGRSEVYFLSVMEAATDMRAVCSSYNWNSKVEPVNLSILFLLTGCHPRGGDFNARIPE